MKGDASLGAAAAGRRGWSAFAPLLALARLDVPGGTSRRCAELPSRAATSSTGAAAISSISLMRRCSARCASSAARALLGATSRRRALGKRDLGLRCFLARFCFDGDARLFGLALGFGLFGLALHLGDARRLGTPLLFGDARLFGLAILLGKTALLGLTRCLRLPLGLGLSAATRRSSSRRFSSARRCSSTSRCRRAASARRSSSAFALHLDFLLAGFIGEALRLGPRRLALGFICCLRALLIELTARFGFLRRRRAASPPHRRRAARQPCA